MSEHRTTGPWSTFFDRRSGKWRAWKLDGTNAGEASEDYAKVQRDVELRNQAAELKRHRERL